MKKLSGLILDRYDDRDRQFRNVHTESFEKTAHVFTHDELSRLPDETFALIIQDGDTVLKKYSMADRGNTGLSLEYFMEYGHKLPAEAQKVAAANLLRGMAWYGLEPPFVVELEKIALGLGTLMGAMMVPGAVQEANNNLKAVRGAGPGIMTPQQVQRRRFQTMGV